MVQVGGNVLLTGCLPQAYVVSGIISLRKIPGYAKISM